MTLNPVLRRELVERWRGRRAFWVLTIFVLLLGFGAQLLYWIGTSYLQDQFGFRFEAQVDVGPILGRFMFENMLAFVLLLVLFVAPGYAAAQISGERERKTLGLLQITAMRPSGLVFGKLASSVAWVGLLVITSLPFAAALFFLGGITPGDLARSLVFIMGIAISIGAIAIGVSSMVKRTTASIIITYAIVLFLSVGTLFTFALEATIVDTWSNGQDRSAFTMYANPYLGLADAVRAQQESFSSPPSVLTPFAYALPRQNSGGFGFNEVMRGGIAFEDVAVEQGAFDDVFIDRAVAQGEFGGFGGFQNNQSRQPVWLITLGLHLLAGAIAFAVATRRVSIPQGRSLRNREATPDVVPAVVTTPPPPPTTAAQQEAPR